MPKSKQLLRYYLFGHTGPVHANSQSVADVFWAGKHRDVLAMINVHLSRMPEEFGLRHFLPPGCWCTIDDPERGAAEYLMTMEGFLSLMEAFAGRELSRLKSACIQEWERFERFERFG
jgi:hypothetical protein